MLTDERTDKRTETCTPKSPILKQVRQTGDKSSAANYRLISLTCILCKVLEHIKASDVVGHMNKHDLLYDLQHGFREKRSCGTQLTMLVEDFARNICAGKQIDLILLDFSKAFDKVSHSNYFGSSTSMESEAKHWTGFTPSWVTGHSQSFLRVRTQIRPDSVPHLLYINDLPDQIVSQVRLFADDTAIYLTMECSDSHRALRNDIDSLSRWESRWDMKFNPSKCQVVRVTTSRRPINTLYYLHGQILWPVLDTWGWTSLVACRGTPISTESLEKPTALWAF